MNKLFKVLFTFLLLISCFSCSKQDVVKDYSIPTYYHYEADSFYDNVKKLNDFNDVSLKDEFFDLYDNLYNELLKASDLSTVCYINYTEDVTDSYYKEEDIYIEDLVNNMSNEFAKACHNLTSSSMKDLFKEHVGEEIFNNYENYFVKSEEIINLENEENKLTKEYNDLTSKMNDYYITKDGVNYSYGDLSYDPQGFYDKYGDLYYTVLENAYKQFNKDSGEIFIKLVSIRDDLSKLYGYDNYALYADNEIYGRDYTSEDLYYLKEYTKEFADFLLYENIVCSNYEDLDIDTNELIKTVLTKVSSFSSILKDSYKVFDDNHLYSIDSSDTRYNGSYDTTFECSDASFVFLNRSNTVNDYFTLAHEFGHFTNGINVKNYDPICVSGSYDVFEIHSTALEMLFGLKAENIFVDNYDEMNMYNLADKFTNLVDGCLYDDFQRTIYENPDMTLDEINSLFEDLLKEYGYYILANDYGAYDYESIKYMWSQVPHNFNSPMYYVSYATSAFTAIEIWQIANKNFSKAYKYYENILLSDPYRNGYLSITSDSGLANITDSEAVYNTYYEVYDYFMNS